MLKILISLISIFWIAFPLSFQIRNLVKGNTFLRVVRIFSMYMPYLVVYLFCSFPKYNIHVNLSFLLIVIIFSIFYLLVDLNIFYHAFNEELYGFIDRVGVKQLLSRAGEFTIVPIVEELFFRGVIPINTDIIESIFIFCISTFLFCLAHYIGRDSGKIFQMKVLMLSIVSFLLYYLTQNIIYSILFHMLCNFPWFLVSIHQFLYFKRKE